MVGGEAEEEGFAGDDEDVAGFEFLVEFLAADGQLREPEPEEERAFALVDGVGEAVGGGGIEPRLRLAGAFLVEGADCLLG